MGNLSDIKRRLQSVKQTRQITGAMEMVSIVKMRKATAQCENSRAYVELLKDMFGCIAASSGSAVAELFAKPNSGKRYLIVLSSDKGLCGGFDNDIFRVADKYTDENTTVFPVGMTAASRYKGRANADMRFADCYAAEYAVAEHMAQELCKEYGTAASCVSIAYTRMESNAGGKATVDEILPVPAEITNNKQAETELPECGDNSDTAEILRKLYVAGSVYGALVNNCAAEQCARHAAMSAAADSADEIIAQLSLEYNRARQSAVTEQITEITGTAAALTKGVGYEKS